MTVPRVVLYSRPACHLCDEARAVILRVREGIAFDLEEFDIDERDDWVKDYGLRIPVVLVDGTEAFEISVDPGELRALLGG